MQVLQAYQAGINGSTLAGPSYFSNLLNRIKTEIEDSIEQTGLTNNRLYHLVILVTDGNCHDMEATKKALVSLAGMPFSAVVVGVGDGKFEDMEELDADDEVLKDADGKAACRDIVQLVSYEAFKELGMRELALEVLGEVPDQFVEYMVMKEENTNPHLYKGKNPEKWLSHRSHRVASQESARSNGVGPPKGKALQHPDDSNLKSPG